MKCTVKKDTYFDRKIFNNTWYRFPSIEGNKNERKGIIWDFFILISFKIFNHCAILLAIIAAIKLKQLVVVLINKLEFIKRKKGWRIFNKIYVHTNFINILKYQQQFTKTISTTFKVFVCSKLLQQKNEKLTLNRPFERVKLMKLE